MFSSLRLVSSRYFSSACLRHQFQFDLGTLLLRGLRLRCGAFSALRRGRPGPRGLRFPARPVVHHGCGGGAISPSSSRGALVQLDVVGQQARSLYAQALHFARQIWRGGLSICRICISRRASDARSDRARSSRPASSARRAACSSRSAMCVGLQPFEFGARRFERLFLSKRACSFSATNALALVRAGRGIAASSRARRSSSRRATERREPARAYSSASLRCSWSSARASFSWVCAGRAELSRSSASCGGAAFQVFELARSDSWSRAAGFHLAAQFAQFALQGQRTACRFSSAADGVAVIADAVLQQEVAIGIAIGEPLRGARDRSPGSSGPGEAADPAGPARNRWSGAACRAGGRRRRRSLERSGAWRDAAACFGMD